jgi:hypothetical protein
MTGTLRGTLPWLSGAGLGAGFFKMPWDAQDKYRKAERDKDRDKERDKNRDKEQVRLKESDKERERKGPSDYPESSKHRKSERSPRPGGLLVAR